jgi:hypothetical protein
MAEDLAASTAANMFQIDGSVPDIYSQEYARLAQEQNRHFVHNQHIPYNYAMSNPFGLPQPTVQSSVSVDPSATFQEYFVNSFPSDSPFTNIFGSDIQ